MLLLFKVADVRRLIKLTREAKGYTKSYGVDDKGRCLIIVKDEGAYIMSNGNPRPKDDVVYADGYGPDCEHIGGDDFADSVPLRIWEGVIKGVRGTKTLKIKLDEKEIGFEII